VGQQSIKHIKTCFYLSVVCN